MIPISALENVDIYLIDQLLKGAIGSTDSILDAGCGSGRNLHFFVQQGYAITGFDSKEEHIRSLQERHPKHADRFFVNSIEDFQTENHYDYIICCAVLHFAKNHAHFETLFSRLVDLLAPGGTLFVRMTTTMGMDVLPTTNDGTYNLPDGTRRYLVTREQLDVLCKKHALSLVGPAKTVLVDHLRSMGIFVFKKD